MTDEDRKRRKARELRTFGIEEPFTGRSCFAENPARTKVCTFDYNHEGKHSWELTKPTTQT